jgi:pimeloyl-ACP methyl ester carboxylesterase
MATHQGSAADVIALIEALGGPAIVVGNSMAAGSAVLVAAEPPRLVAGLVLTGAFVRDHKTSLAQRITLRVAMARPWAATSWKAYLPKLYSGRLGDVTAPTLVIMGEEDLDFGDPRAEADRIAEALHGQAVMVPDAGHYPQSQRADITNPAVVHFVDTVNHRA